MIIRSVFILRLSLVPILTLVHVSEHTLSVSAMHPSFSLSSAQVLTLASNERISLSTSMRLLFEISHLKAATPATVSRAGILYVNPQDLGWSS